MASKTSKRLSKLTDKMAECKSAQQSRKSRRIAIANAKLSKAMPPPKSIPSPKNTKPPKIVKPIRNTVIVEAPKSVKSTVNPGQVNAEIIKLDVNKSSDTRARIALPDRVKPVERIEFYPEKLKRKRFTKKIVLGPKHNYKVVAAINKRKSFTPHREGTPQQPTNIVASRFTYKNAQPSTSQSVKDKVAEQANLACPNPVWRVNRPDERSAEDPIYAIMTHEYLQEDDFKELAENPLQSNQLLINYQIIDKTMKMNPINNHQNGMFIKKQRKLESILCNIVQKLDKTEEKYNDIDNYEKSSNCSESFDLNFSEDVINRLENIGIPIKSQNISSRDNSVVPIEMPPLTRKPVFKNQPMVLPDSNFEFDSISDTNIHFISDDDVSSNETNLDEIHNLCSNRQTKRSLDTTNWNYNNKNNYLVVNECENQNATENKTCSNKNVKSNLSNYITVYKIIPETSSLENLVSKTENSSKNKMIGIRGKLSNFF